MKLSETVDRKFIESYQSDRYEVWTDTGWQPVVEANLTEKYQVYILTLDNGMVLKCADNHIVFRYDMSEVFVKDLVPGDLVVTESGNSSVVSVDVTDVCENMYDFCVDSEYHRYYTDGILSHNSTTTVAYFLWTICFDVEKIIGIFANKQATSVELLGRLKLAYEHLPIWLKSGIVIWNKTAIELDNGCRVMAFSTSSASARGFSFSQILIDEAAFIPPQMFQEFFESTIPVVASGKNTKITIVSTPNGFNHFYKIFNDSLNGVAEYHPYKIEWNEVPGRDEEWKQEQIRKLGSLEAFEKEFACEFLGSSNTLFSKSALQSLSANNPVGTMNGVKIYEKPKEGHTYIITVDTAEGVGLDYSSFIISDVTEYPFQQAAVFHDNRIDALRLPNLIISTAKYYNDAFVFIELNSTGKQVADIVKYDLEYEYILHTRLIKNKLRLQYYGIGKNSVWNGLKQTRATKSVGCNTIKTLVESQKYIIQDMDTINEASTFVQSGFSYAAEPGSHDDLMMCLVLFGWIATQGIFEEMSSRDIRKEVADSYEKEVEENLVFFIENSNKQQDNTFRDEQGIVWNISGR